MGELFSALPKQWINLHEEKCVWGRLWCCLKAGRWLCKWCPSLFLGRFGCLCFLGESSIADTKISTRNSANRSLFLALQWKKIRKNTFFEKINFSLRRENFGVGNMLSLNELNLALILELFEETLILSFSELFEVEFLKKPMSLVVTTGLVQGDCSGVVWQLWWRGPCWIMNPRRPTTGEPTVSWEYCPFDDLNLSTLFRGGSTF